MSMIVHSVVELADEGSFDFDVSVDDLGRMNFTLVPGDTAPLAQALTAWLGANPSWPIVEYEPPPEGPNVLPNLKPYQFWGAVRATGYEGDLQAWVTEITDPVQQAHDRGGTALSRHDGGGAG